MRPPIDRNSSFLGLMSQVASLQRSESWARKNGSLRSAALCTPNAPFQPHRTRCPTASGLLPTAQRKRCLTRPFAAPRRCLAPCGIPTLPTLPTLFGRASAFAASRLPNAANAAAPCLPLGVAMRPTLLHRSNQASKRSQRCRVMAVALPFAFNAVAHSPSSCPSASIVSKKGCFGSTWLGVWRLQGFSVRFNSSRIYLPHCSAIAFAIPGKVRERYFPLDERTKHLNTGLVTVGRRGGRFLSQ